VAVGTGEATDVLLAGIFVRVVTAGTVGVGWRLFFSGTKTICSGG